MQNELSGIQNLSVNALVSPNGNDITMLYQVDPGPCEKSFGIEVAKIAKFPQSIIDSALKISADLERRSKDKISL
jgi:DNA mismatch repair ATPase MutS